MFNKNIHFGTEFQYRVSFKNNNFQLDIPHSLYSPKNDNKQSSEMRNMNNDMNKVK